MPELEHDKLSELLELTKENNRMLRAMHRAMIWGKVFTFIYWLFILGVMGWSYIYFQPYIEQYLDLFKQMSTRMNELEKSGITFPSNFQGLLEKVR